MAITATLVERTPYAVRYKCISNGGATASPDSVVIPNADATTPDLRVDAGGFQGSPIDVLVSKTPIADQAAARALFDGQGLTAPATEAVKRGHLKVTPCNSLGDQHWGLDANDGTSAGSAPSAGYAVLVVTGPNVNLAAAIVELRVQHTSDL